MSGVTEKKNRNWMKEIPEEFRKIDIFKICSYFLVCAFVGWIWETLVVWGMTGELTDRGFLFIMKPLSKYLPFLKNAVGLGSVPFIWGLPIIGIYGVGGAIVCSLFKRWERNIIELFFIGLVSLTLLELFASYLCDWLLHHKYWDYTGHLLSFQGRICLYSMLSWGFLTVVAVKVVAPRIDRIYMHVKGQRIFKIVIIVLMVYVAVCALTKYAIDPTIIPN